MHESIVLTSIAFHLVVFFLETFQIFLLIKKCVLLKCHVKSFLPSAMRETECIVGTSVSRAYFFWHSDLSAEQNLLFKIVLNNLVKSYKYNTEDKSRYINNNRNNTPKVYVDWQYKMGYFTDLANLLSGWQSVTKRNFFSIKWHRKCRQEQHESI